MTSGFRGWWLWLPKGMAVVGWNDSQYVICSIFV